MPDYSQLLSCTYGSATMDLEGYQVKETPEVKEGVGRTATQVQVTLDGLVRGSSAEDLSDKLLALVQEMRTDGRDLVIVGLSQQTEYAFLAAEAFDGGPFAAVTVAESTIPLAKKITVTLQGSKPPAGSNGNPTNTYKVTTTVRPDGLKTITWTGEIAGADASDYFLRMVLPRFPYAAPQWVVDYEYVGGKEGLNTKTTYRLTAREMDNPLPDFGAAGRAFDGSATRKTDRDEQMRKTTSWEFNLLLGNVDPVNFVTQLRAQVSAGGVVILRESVTVQTLTETRVQATFSTLQSAGADALMNWSESIKISPPAIVWEEKTYYGTDPILVARPRTVGRIVQSGSAIAAGVYLRAPSPAFNLWAAEPEISLSEINEIEKGTNWTLTQFLTDAEGKALTPQQAAAINPVFQARKNQDNAFYSADGKAPNTP